MGFIRHALLGNTSRPFLIPESVNLDKKPQPIKHTGRPSRPHAIGKPMALQEMNYPLSQPAQDSLKLSRSSHAANRAHQSDQHQIVPYAPLTQNPSVSDIAAELSKSYAQSYGTHLQTIRQHLHRHGQLSGRVKTALSIGDKLRRLAESEDRARLNTNWAQSRISDGLGFRLTLKQGGPSDMDACVKTLAQLIESGQMEILSLSDYHGPNTPSYLSKENLRILLKAQERAPQKQPFYRPVEVLHNVPEAIKESGYTALQIKVRFPDRTRGELQIRGPQVEKIAAVEHLVYDIRRQKTVLGKHRVTSRGVDRARLETIIQALSPSQTQDYLSYLANYYQKARALEVGHSKSPLPTLPESLTHYPLLDLSRMHGSKLGL